MHFQTQKCFHRASVSIRVDPPANISISLTLSPPPLQVFVPVDIFLCSYILSSLHAESWWILYLKSNVQSLNVVLCITRLGINTMWKIIDYTYSYLQIVCYRKKLWPTEYRTTSQCAFALIVLVWRFPVCCREAFSRRGVCGGYCAWFNNNKKEQVGWMISQPMCAWPTGFFILLE